MKLLVYALVFGVKDGLDVERCRMVTSHIANRPRVRRERFEPLVGDFAARVSWLVDVAVSDGLANSVPKRGGAYKTDGLPVEANGLVSVQRASSGIVERQAHELPLEALCALRL